MIERRLQLLEKADGPEYQITRIKRPIIDPDGQLVGISVYENGVWRFYGDGTDPGKNEVENAFTECFAANMGDQMGVNK